VVRTTKRTSEHLDGVKPATFGSLPSKKSVTQHSGSFRRLEDESSRSETELDLFRATARPSVSVGPKFVTDEWKVDNCQHIQVKSDVEVSFEDDGARLGNNFTAC
jgi:hypothetical protein